MESTPPEGPPDATGVTSIIDAPTPMPAPDVFTELTPMSMQATAGNLTVATENAASFVDALRTSEIERTRRLVPSLFVVTMFAGAFLFVFGGETSARPIVYVGVGCGVLSAIYLYYLTLDQQRYTEGRVVAANSILILAIYAAVYFVGAFSAGSSIIMLAIFLMGVDRKGTGAFVLYAVAASLHLLLAAAFASGAVEDIGIISSSGLTSTEIWAGEGLIQVLFIASLLIARAIREQLSGAVAQHEGSVRDHARRGALLEEAREALDRALHASGRGPFTGQQLGSYRLGNLLGRGGTGEVYEAEHTEKEERAAVKLLSLPALGVPGLLDRFIREAQLAASVVSPHVVKLLEVSDEDSPLPYIAMERLVGNDLSYFLRDTGAMPIDRVIVMVNQIAQGLEATRTVGIVHRDITPRNLYMTGDIETPVWKILDFGISKTVSARATLTKGDAIGTPRYMAPEQAQGKVVDHRADAYSLAAVAYRALTGRPPITGKDVPALLHNVAYQMPARPSSMADLATSFDYVLLVGLSKDPKDRFRTALELAEALSAAASDKIQSDLKARGQELAKRQPWGGKVPRKRRASM